MSYDPNVLRRASEALEQQRRTHQLNQARLRIDAYSRQPRLEELDRQLQGTMAQLVSAALRKGENARDAVTAIRDRNLAIQAERAELLAKLGLSADALDDAPMCPHCSDTGWKGARMCTCLKKLYAQEQIGELSKLLDLGSQSFDTFRMDYYSPQRREGHPVSPRENMEMVLAVCQTYATSSARAGSKTSTSTAPPVWARPSCRPASPGRYPNRAALWCMTRRATSSPSLKTVSSPAGRTTGTPGTRRAAI